MFLENDKHQLYGSVETYGTLTADEINRLIQAFTTRKRIETWLDYGSANNGITGKILEPYTKKELAAIFWPNAKEFKMERFLDGDEIKSMSPYYKSISRRFTLALSELYCKTRFVEDKK